MSISSEFFLNNYLKRFKTFDLKDLKTISNGRANTFVKNNDFKQENLKLKSCRERSAVVRNIPMYYESKFRKAKESRCLNCVKLPKCTTNCAGVK